jgi:hypothetical protein
MSAKQVKTAPTATVTEVVKPEEITTDGALEQVLKRVAEMKTRVAQMAADAAASEHYIRGAEDVIKELRNILKGNGENKSNER